MSREHSWFWLDGCPRTPPPTDPKERREQRADREFMQRIYDEDHRRWVEAGDRTKEALGER